jgi:exonuclease SbcC
MIPIQLKISGFLSYREPVVLDFTGFELACISGSNGSGKSSLLDAITWALFGQARKRDDSLVNQQSSVAEVILIFEYEGNVYRIQRTMPREKTSALEFQILQYPPGAQVDMGLIARGLNNSEYHWRVLTERTLRETQARIEQTLRLDYDTFVNASFFLQGKADQFTQQRPGDRKRILGNILGLEVWETYRQRAAERRRSVEGEIASLDGRLNEIQAELSEENQRRLRLRELQDELARLEQARSAQEQLLEKIRKIVATLSEQRKMVDTLTRQLQTAESRLDALEKQSQARQQEREDISQTLAQAGQIEAAYIAWQQARAELQEWETVAVRFREHEKRRQAPLDEINAERVHLQTTLETLQTQRTALQAQQAGQDTLQIEIQRLRRLCTEAEEALTQKQQLELELQEAVQRASEARAENPRLRAEMDELKARISQLDALDGASCPLCGQPLNPIERQRLIEELTAQGKELGDRYRANQALLSQADDRVKGLKAEIERKGRSEADLRACSQALAQNTIRLEQVEALIAEWQANGAPKLEQVQSALQAEAFAGEARARLAEIDAELRQIGYDAAAHDNARQIELEGRAAEAGLRKLESQRAVLGPLEREITELNGQIQVLRMELEQQRTEQRAASDALQAAEAQAPDLAAAERLLLELQEQENRLRMEVGAARQKVLVLGDLKARQKKYSAEREALALSVGQYRQLERAFGKDGVPALLIEQAIPQIESHANEILDRLSSGGMSVRFLTQAAYKDKRREDLRETLEIQISDSAGTRDYEMYSGGEAFRVNFAIRLALAEELARRAGARLQTLVIDEGFGSQDEQGRQRLVEAINTIRQDFAKILVITHIDELKDHFPARIEVEKTSRGSQVRVL